MSVVALLTDFGLLDPYVGIMKGVIATLAPGVPIIDITHGVPPQDILVGALHLDAAWRYFPPGTVFVVVVDPGVGSARRPLVATTQGRHFVGPDNGVLSVLPNAIWRRIEADWGLPDRSRTFHGRDLFAPVAARLVRGAPIDAVGPQVHDPLVLRIPEPLGHRGQILTVDHYGNAITNFPGQGAGRVRVGSEVIPIRGTYADVATGDAVALTGSTGRLEIAIRDGDAATTLGLEPGTEVLLLPPEP